jgi:hypothetical protein
MSGRPTHAGVAEYLALLTRLGEVNETLARLEPEEERFKSSIASLREERGAIAVNLRAKLDEMDVDGPGNFGWEGRIAWMIQEAIRQDRASRAPLAKAAEPAP